MCGDRQCSKVLAWTGSNSRTGDAARSPRVSLWNLWQLRLLKLKNGHGHVVLAEP